MHKELNASFAFCSIYIIIRVVGILTTQLSCCFREGHSQGPQLLITSLTVRENVLFYICWKVRGGKKHNPRKVCRGKVLSRVPLFLLFSYPQTALWLFPSVSISGRPAMCLVASEPHEMVTSTLIRTGRALPFQQGRRPGRSVYRMPPAKEKPHSRL